MIIKLVKLFFFLTFSVFLVIMAGFTIAGEPNIVCEINNGRIIVLKTEIRLVEGKDNAVNVLPVAPWEIKHACIDPKEEYIFTVLGRKGALRGERLALFSIRKNQIDRIWLDKNWGYNPWKVLIRDVDGDGKLDLCVGAWKKTKFHPVFDNRLFIYNWEKDRLSPKWLGSRLSSPFLDFEFKDVDHDGIEELIALELQRNHLRRIMSYKWKGFGFEGFRILVKDLKIQNLNTLGAGGYK